MLPLAGRPPTPSPPISLPHPHLVLVLLRGWWLHRSPPPNRVTRFPPYSPVPPHTPVADDWSLFTRRPVARLRFIPDTLIDPGPRRKPGSLARLVRFACEDSRGNWIEAKLKYGVSVMSLRQISVTRTVDTKHSPPRTPDVATDDIASPSSSRVCFLSRNLHSNQLKTTEMIVLIQCLFTESARFLFLASTTKCIVRSKYDLHVYSTDDTRNTSDLNTAYPLFLRQLCGLPRSNQKGNKSSVCTKILGGTGSARRHFRTTECTWHLSCIFHRKRHRKFNAETNAARTGS